MAGIGIGREKLFCRYSDKKLITKKEGRKKGREGENYQQKMKCYFGNHHYWGGWNISKPQVTACQGQVPRPTENSKDELEVRFKLSLLLTFN